MWQGLRMLGKNKSALPSGCMEQRKGHSMTACESLHNFCRRGETPERGRSFRGTGWSWGEKREWCLSQVQEWERAELEQMFRRPTSVQEI